LHAQLSLKAMPDERIQFTFTDITELKNAEETIRQLNVDLEARVIQRTAELEAANRELEAFSYSVSHDLRAPLRAIDGYSHIFMEEYQGQLDAQALELLGNVRQGVHKMNQLIDHLLLFSRLGREALNIQTLSADEMHEIVAIVIAGVRAVEPERHIEVQVNDLQACQADLTLLQQVYTNLISNAFKFTSNQEQARIEIGCQKTPDGECAYYVGDNGVGFNTQYQNKLFGIFERLHPETEFPGHGVGLAIVKRIIQRHGGRVWAEGEVGQGATFYFTLPKQEV
jgi:light-regulated signal transduction histidine kinase (bacteriophytochrome)